MRALYLDNFRGFKDEFIRLCSVNFLVGENSSGKTSLLAVIRILGTYRFWMTPSFDDPDLPFSSFSEIVSKNSSNKRYFTIAYYNDDDADETEIVFMFITFKNEEGTPVVYKYSFLSPTGMISTIISDSQLSYKITKYSDKNPEEMIKYCSSIHSESSYSGYKKISKKGFNREIYFSNAYHFIYSDLIRKKNQEHREITSHYNHSIPTCRWIAPIRAKPEKIYSNQSPNYSSEGMHIPYVLNRITKKNDRNIGKNTKKAIKEFGETSGVFDSIGIKRFGNDASSPFEVNVNLGKYELPISNVGYGVSQVLPIILEARRKSDEDYIAIQQPEVHLHPKAQAALGEFIYNSQKTSENNFLIETHSDYLIDRYRLCVNKNKEIENSQVLFFERSEKGNKTFSIPIQKDGTYARKQPKSFRDFFIKEEMELLNI